MVNCVHVGFLFKLLHAYVQCVCIVKENGSCWESYFHGKGQPLGSLVCDVFLCFCHFSMLCPGSGVVLPDVLPSYLLPSKAVVGVDRSMYALLYHKHIPFIKSHLQIQM